jgi:hypothetical protein
MELCPEKRFLRYPNLPKVIGSDFLGARVQNLMPDLHVFGHTHFGWDQELDGKTRFALTSRAPRFMDTRFAFPSEGSFHFVPVHM